MNTPIYDFVSEYIKSDVSRLHMPGHKGKGPLGIEERDITEVSGADVLYECDGIIAESEKNATALFGTGRTVYSTEGSSHVIKAMLFLALQRAKRNGLTGRPVILAARNVHKSFIYACALMGIDVEWIYPENAESSICSCHPTAKQIEAAIKSMKHPPFAVYVTSPDYLGTMADIQAISRVIGDIPLLVDNAHGAYLHFLDTPQHPIDLGAYMCADSAHKTLPVLTGGAYLQMSANAANEIGSEANAALSLFGSTSPSYVIMQSLDLANAYMDAGYREKLCETVNAIDALKTVLSGKGIAVENSEALKLVINTASLGMSGEELGAHLRAHKIECEFTDVNYLVLMFTPENSARDFQRIYEAVDTLTPAKGFVSAEVLSLSPLNKALTIREAIFAAHENVKVDDCLGRICGQPSVSCPPAIPIAVSGEVIDSKIIALFKRYGINEISVIKK